MERFQDVVDASSDDFISTLADFILSQNQEFIEFLLLNYIPPVPTILEVGQKEERKMRVRFSANTAMELEEATQKLRETTAEIIRKAGEERRTNVPTAVLLENEELKEIKTKLERMARHVDRSPEGKNSISVHKPKEENLSVFDPDYAPCLVIQFQPENEALRCALFAVLSERGMYVQLDKNRITILDDREGENPKEKLLKLLRDDESVGKLVRNWQMAYEGAKEPDERERQ